MRYGTIQDASQRNLVSTDKSKYIGISYAGKNVKQYLVCLQTKTKDVCEGWNEK